MDLTTSVEAIPGRILADLVTDFFLDPWFSFQVKKFVSVTRYFEIKQQRLMVGIKRARARELLERQEQMEG